MKGLSLTQPWATLVAIGAKRYETRSWSTNYRGRVLIHAAKGFPTEAKAFAQIGPVWTLLGRQGIDCATLPLGAVVAIATLANVFKTADVRDRLTAQELHLGGYSDGRFAWELTEVVRLDKPVACKGMLGLWRVPGELAFDVLASLDGPESGRLPSPRTPPSRPSRPS